MAYSEQTATNVDDVPALISAFAGDRGWSVVDNKITRPDGGRQFEITTSHDTSYYSLHRILVTDTADPKRSVWTSLPQLNGTDANNPQVLTPSKVHLFGNDTPYNEEGSVAPWIACVIECGYNHYRHIYIGNMVKFGSYTGGEIICANYFNQYPGDQWSEFSFGSSYNKYLFSANNWAGRGYGPGPDVNNSEELEGTTGGGVNVVHSDNPNSWRNFYGPTGNSMIERLTGDEVFGGAQDSINSGLVRRGVSDFAGAQILVPVNLFVPNGDDGVDYRFRPIGFVPGVRMVDMRDIQSGETIAVGNRNWKVFAEFQRNPNPNVKNRAYNPDGYWWNEETSYYLGLAYPESDS